MKLETALSTDADVDDDSDVDHFNSDGPIHSSSTPAAANVTKHSNGSSAESTGRTSLSTERGEEPSTPRAPQHSERHHALPQAPSTSNNARSSRRPPSSQKRGNRAGSVADESDTDFQSAYSNSPEGSDGDGSSTSRRSSTQAAPSPTTNGHTEFGDTTNGTTPTETHPPTQFQRSSMATVTGAKDLES